MSERRKLQGIGLRLLSVLLMTTTSAAVHGAADTVPIGQIIFWRSSLALIPIVLYMALREDFPKVLATSRPGMHATRSLLGVFSMALLFIALANLPVAVAQALAYLAPVMILPLAAFQLKEPLGARKYISVAIGFGGVVALLWEALELPGEGAVIGIAAGLAYAVTMAFIRIHTKRMTMTERSSTIAFYFALVAAVVGLLTLPFGWVSLTMSQFGWLATAGLVGGAGHIVSNEAVARAPVSTLAPFDYTGLIWALGFDFVLFATLPGPLGLAGLLAITGAALLVSLPETRR